MTLLLNGQAVKVLFGSTSVTCSFGSIAFSARAQLAPPKPPPITTTRGAACANAGSGNASAVTVAALAPQNSRRLMRWLIPMLAPLLLLCREPRRNRAQLVVGEALGDAVHDGGGKRAVAKSSHRGHDLTGVATVQPRNGPGRRCPCGVAAGAGCRARRGLGSRQRRQARRHNRCNRDGDTQRFHLAGLPMGERRHSSEAAARCRQANVMF